MSIYGDKHVKSSIYKAMKQCRWCDWFFPEGQKVLPPANETEAWISGACASWEGQWVEGIPEQEGLLGGGGSEVCSSRCLAPSPRAPCMGSSGPPSGIERHRCTSYTFSGENHIHPLWYLPQAFLCLFPWLLCSNTFPETNSWVHTQLFKQTWLPYSFACLFILAAPQSLWDFSSLVRDRTQGPWQWKQSLNQWTTREFPYYCFNNKLPDVLIPPSTVVGFSCNCIKHKCSRNTFHYSGSY